MTCHAEEDKLTREGSAKRRIMGLRKESLIFILLVGALRLPRQGENEGREQKGMIVTSLPYMLSTHSGGSHAHTHTYTQTYTHTYIKTYMRTQKKTTKSEFV